MLTPLFPAALSQHFHARTGVNEWIEELTPIDPLKFTFKSITHAQIPSSARYEQKICISQAQLCVIGLSLVGLILPSLVTEKRFTECEPNSLRNPTTPCLSFSQTRG